MVRVRTMRWGAVLLALLVWAVPARGQVLVNTGNLTAANQEVTAGTGGLPAIMVDVSGTFSGTITFGCAGGENTYTTVMVTSITDGSTATTTTTTGKWTIPNVGCSQVRARMTAYASGTAVISFTSAYWNAKLMTPSFTTVFLGDGTAPAPSLTFASDPDTGIYHAAANAIGFTGNGALIGWLDISGFSVGSGFLGFGATPASADVQLWRDAAADTLAQRRGLNAQAFRVYKTFTDASNYENFFVDTTGATMDLGSGKAGTGTGRGVRILTGNSLVVAFDTSAGSMFSGKVVSISPSAGVGYATGSGGAITQATSRVTGVTLSTVTGDITLFSAAGSATPASFVVTNTTVAITDNVVINQKSGTDLYEIFVTNVAAGSFKVTFFTTGGTTVEQPVFHFSIVKGVTS